jgi:hypothetical protein
MADKSSGPDIIPIQSGMGEIHPKSFLDAISYIDQSYANERGGCVIDPRFLTTKQRLEFMEVGIRSSLASGVMTILFTPLALAVIEKSMPIFGSTAPTIGDKCCALLLALFFSLGYSIFLGMTATHWVGGYTKTMISNLLSGMATGAFIKAVIAFIGFHVLYFKIFTEDNVVWALSQLYHIDASQDLVTRLYLWVMDFKGVFITSAYFVAITSAIYIIIPYACMAWASIRNKKLIATGVVSVYEDTI